MKLGKQHVARFFFVVEIIVFAGFYIFGTNGIMALWAYKKDIQ